MRVVIVAAIAALTVAGCRPAEKAMGEDAAHVVDSRLHPKPQEPRRPEHKPGEIPEGAKRWVEAGHHAYDESEKQREQGSENSSGADQRRPPIDPNAPLVRDAPPPSGR